MNARKNLVLFAMVTVIPLHTMKRAEADFLEPLPQQQTAQRPRLTKGPPLLRAKRFSGKMGGTPFVLVFTEKRKEIPPVALPNKISPPRPGSLAEIAPTILMPIPVRALPSLPDLLVRCGYDSRMYL